METRKKEKIMIASLAVLILAIIGLSTYLFMSIFGSQIKQKFSNSEKYYYQLTNTGEIALVFVNERDFENYQWIDLLDLNSDEWFVNTDLFYIQDGFHIDSSDLECLERTGYGAYDFNGDGIITHSELQETASLVVDIEDIEDYIPKPATVDLSSNVINVRTDFYADGLCKKSTQLKATDDELFESDSVEWKHKFGISAVEKDVYYSEKEWNELTHINLDNPLCRYSKATENMFSTIAEGESGNVFISPFSIYSALGMLENGSDGKTMQQLENKLNAGMTIKELNDISGILNEKMRYSTSTKVMNANSIWLNKAQFKTISVKDTYINDLKKYYNAQVWEGKFNKDTVKDINNWTSYYSNGTFDNVVKKEDIENSACFLLNTIYFEGRWDPDYEFDKEPVYSYDEYEKIEEDYNDEGNSSEENESDSSEEWEDPIDYPSTCIIEDYPFNNFDKSESKVTMLHTGGIDWFGYGDSKCFILHYKDTYDFVGILPDIDIDQFIKKMPEYEPFNSAYLNDVVDGSEAYIYLPEFEWENDIKLRDYFEKLGATDIFDAKLADFSKMCDENIYVSDAFHKAKVKVDRYGTVAAAVTGITEDLGFMIPEPPKEIIIKLDRPFLYAIVDQSTGTPIFMGVIKNL